MPSDVGSYFSPDYATARARFRESLKNAGGRLDPLELEAKDPSGERLTIDIACLDRRSRSEFSSILQGCTGLRHLPAPQFNCSGWSKVFLRFLKTPRSYLCTSSTRTE